ncbi:hypothetical protein SKAU_G00319330 [Synaphobranchus kaupii]|uniref:Adenomatous polyposis coli protein basic domain-containing protein n=1 Tax=Synaphobranchus kaupii TaxID=118154 RepID=A0A9Q1ENC4_SYNKA|nr:hypothetical protein SKAU_G00319330 [Synaphobranchus kaupii]
MIYFTVERPTENFSCASSLSALPLHEHYIQKDVELKLTPLLHQRGGGNSNNLGAGAWDEQGGERPSVLDMERYSEGNSDDDIEILKECISSAMPSRFKTRTSLLANLPRPVFGAQNHSDSPMNISSTTSLSDETLRYAAKEPGVDPDVKRIEELRAFSRFHRPARTVGQPPVVSDQMNRTFRRSSLRSLSITSLEEGYGKTWVRNRHHATPGHTREAARLPSGHSRGSGWRPLAKKKTEKRQRAKTEREAAQNAFGSWDSDRDPGSEGDTASDSDLNSVEWRAIQEEAAPTKALSAKNPSLAQHRSKSLHRLAQPSEEQPEFFLPKRSSTPPARIPKSSSSGSTSSQSSTTLKRPQRKSSSPWPVEKPAQKSGGVKAAVSSPCRSRKEAISPPSTKRSATPRPPEPKKTHKSPVRIPFMQTLPKPPSRTISPLVTSEPSGNVGQQRSPAVRVAGKLHLLAAALNPPLRSGRAPTYNSDRSGFLRQLTFIKESPPRVSRREAMGAGGSRSVPTSQYASPRRTRPVAPAVFLCSSRCQELKATVQKQQPQVQGRGLNPVQGAGLGAEAEAVGTKPNTFEGQLWQ